MPILFLAENAPNVFLNEDSLCRKVHVTDDRRMKVLKKRRRILLPCSHIPDFFLKPKCILRSVEKRL